MNMRKLVSALLCLIMIISLLPVNAYADSGDMDRMGEIESEDCSAEKTTETEAPTALLTDATEKSSGQPTSDDQAEENDTETSALQSEGDVFAALGEDEEPSDPEQSESKEEEPMTEELKADFEMSVGETISGTVDLQEPEKTILLQIPKAGTLQATIKGGVSVSVSQEPVGSRLQLVGEQNEDGQWAETVGTGLFAAGSCFVLIRLQDGQEQSFFTWSIKEIGSEESQPKEDIMPVEEQTTEETDESTEESALAADENTEENNESAADGSTKENAESAALEEESQSDEMSISSEKLTDASEESFNGFSVSMEDNAGTVTLSEADQGVNQAIRMAVDGNEYDALLKIEISGMTSNSAAAKVQSEEMKKQSARKYRVVYLQSSNEAVAVSGNNISDNGELGFSAKGNGTYVLVRLKGVELDPSTDQGSPAFYVEFATGAELIGEDYVWKATNPAKGHRYVFRINYRLLIYTDQEAEKVKMVIPEHILRDRFGEDADGIEFSIPSKTEADKGGEVDETVFFAWTRELDDDEEPTGNIIIYNFRTMERGTRNGFIELAYYTTKQTIDYIDYNPENPEQSRSKDFHCELYLPNKNKLDSRYIPVYMDTTATVASVEKKNLTHSETWSESWGDPADFGITDANAYQYLIWTVTTQISLTQPYDITIKDLPLTEGMKVLAVRWSGDTKYTLPDADGSFSKSKQQSDRRYDYILTCVDSSVFFDETKGILREKWEVDNHVDVTITPGDHVDSASTASAEGNYQYEVPYFEDPEGHFDAWKRADGAWRRYDKNIYYYTTGKEVFNPLSIVAGSYTRYDLERFGVHDGVRGPLQKYDNFDYAVWMWGTPYVLTKDWNFSNDINKNYGYFRDYVIYDQWDFEVKLGRSESDLVDLGVGDYRIKSIQYNVLLKDSNVSPTSQTFGNDSGITYDTLIDENDTQGGIGDVLHIYGMNGNGEWVELFRKDYRDGTTWVNEEYASLSNRTIIFKESEDHGKDILLYRTVMKTRHYWASIGTVPEFELYASDTVLDVANESGTICLYNNTYADLYSTWEGKTKHVSFGSDGKVKNTYYTGEDYREYKWTLNLGDEDARPYYRYFHIADEYRRDFDYARSSQSDSRIVKRITATGNETKMARFVISWQVDMQETLNSSSGTNAQANNVPQNGGVFYDLLPKGATVDRKTIKVTSEGAELEYTLKLTPNWRGSSRTMMQVTVKTPGINYSVSYETIHAWTSIKDYGSAVYNPVAYETGNDSIAKGKADDGSGLTGSAEEKALMAGLDPDSGDSQRFIYSDARTDITALIASSIGTAKRVRALSDSTYRSSTYTQQNGIYMYRLNYSPDSQVQAKNLLIMDNIEDSNEAGRQWQGTLYSADPTHPEYSVDIKQLEAAGATPTIYFADHTVSFGNYGDDQTVQDYLAERGLVEVGEFMQSHSLADVKAVAIYCGDDFEMKGTAEEPNKSLTVILYMKAPEYVEEKGNPYPATFNNMGLALRVGVSGESGALEYIPHITITPDTTVFFRVQADVPLKKVSQEDHSWVIPEVQFKLSGSSFYTGNQIELYETTGSNGALTFFEVERGTYYLEEVSCPKDWVLHRMPYQVLIDRYGRLWIADVDTFKTSNGEIQTDPATGRPLLMNGSIASDEYLFSTELGIETVFSVENEPRIYTDFSFYKVGKRDGRPIRGVEFRLEGRSHYDNLIEKTAISDQDGVVSFTDVEWGTYRLTESGAAEGYNLIPSDVIIRVQIGSNRNVRIFEIDPATGNEKEESEWVSISLLGDISIKNPDKYTDIEFYKAERVGEGLRYLPGAKFSLKGSSEEGTSVNLEAESDQDGRVEFLGLEQGIYELKEENAPKNIRITDDGEAELGGSINYQGDPKTYNVIIHGDGTFTIREKTSDNSIGPELGKDSEEHYVFLNTPIAEGEIVITKKWADNLSDQDATDRPFPKLTLITQPGFAANYYTVTFDAFGGYFASGGSMYRLRYRADELPTAAQEQSVPTPLRTNYVFDGWVYRLAGSEELNAFKLSEYTAKATIVAYAKWKPTRFWDYSYKGYAQSFSAPIDGTYLLQLWGAEGGNDSAAGGKGGYSYGYVSLSKGTELYIYVGQRGLSSVAGKGGGWNGGGDAGPVGTSGGGGGATDIRLMKDVKSSNRWSDMDSLQSRIIVAGGGGGGGNGPIGAYGGGLSGGDATTVRIGGKGGTQDSGYAFGQGASVPASDGGGGGGGWYGGFGSSYNGASYDSGGGGGSGYLSDRYIKNGETIAGNNAIPIHILNNPNATGTMIGNSGDGFVRITYVADSEFEDTANYPEQILVAVGDGENGSEDEIHSIDSTDQVDADGNPTAGYWEKTEDDTWIYHFKVVDPKQDYVVFEEAGLEYTRFGFVYESEAMDPGYILLPGESTTATITNSLPAGSLNVTKHITGGNVDQKFRFTVMLTTASGQPVNGVFGNVSFQNGTGVFLLGDGENMVITDLPAGYRYSVSEEAVTDYSPAFLPTNPSGTIVANTTAEVSCTNTYNPPVIDPVNVKLTKVESGHFETPGTYTIRADFKGLDPNVSYGYVIGEERASFTSDENGMFSNLVLTMRNGTTVVFERLPINSQYKFTEAGGDYTATYRITNSSEHGMITQSASNAPVTGSELATAWETAEEKEEITVTFENRVERTVNLSIGKVVNGLDSNADFPITLLISNLTPGQGYKAKKGTDNPYTWTADMNGEIVRTLLFRNGETLLIESLPVGAKYRVAENVLSGYTPSVKINGEATELTQSLPDDGLEGGMAIPLQTLHEGNDVQVVFTNTSKTGALRITKTVSGELGNRDKKFNFKITLVYLYGGEEHALEDTSRITAKLNGEPIELTFAEGVCTVKLGDNDELLLENIYDGVHYSVAETNSGPYRVTVEGNQSGTIQSNISNGIIVVAFTNTLNIIVPTGVMLTIVPGVILVLTAAIGLIVLVRKKKEA